MPAQLTTRTIGSFKGEPPGPLVTVVAALHGNEPAGVRALESVFEQLEKARHASKTFDFRGKLVGFIGNLQAYNSSQRFVEQDLNRLWSTDFLNKIRASPKQDLTAENREAYELFDAISGECQSFDVENIIFLDLHTTSAEGGVFSIPIDAKDSLTLAKRLGAPAIMGLQKSIEGTLLKFASEGGFLPNAQTPKSANPQIHCVAFEAGQHESPQSTQRAAAAIVRCLRAAGCIGEEDLRSFEECSPLPLWLQSPPVLELRYAHHIAPDDRFKMRPGYANFQPVQAGEHLADDIRGPVLSPHRGLILMPLYQPKGADGFFIVQ